MTLPAKPQLTSLVLRWETTRGIFGKWVLLTNPARIVHTFDMKSFINPVPENI